MLVFGGVYEFVGITPRTKKIQAYPIQNLEFQWEITIAISNQSFPMAENHLAPQVK